MAAEAKSDLRSSQAKGDPNNIKVGLRCRPLSKMELGLGEESIAEFSPPQLCMTAWSKWPGLQQPVWAAYEARSPTQGRPLGPRGDASPRKCRREAAAALWCLPSVAHSAAFDHPGMTNPHPEKSDKPENYLFTYDFVYDSTVPTETVYQDMGAPLVEKLFEGFNGTLFAYGQTGSGKTYSMMGSAADPGVIPRVVRAIFHKCTALPEGVTVTVRASYLQIYREVLQDLSSLKAPADDLKIRRDPKLGTYVQGLTETELTTPEELAHLIDEGNKRRATATTLMNSESSRSHAVVVVKVEQYTEATRTRMTSKINLVDLAGSERASKTGASGDTLKEAISINQSLSALGNVINALTDVKFKGHIPYRSSKLTHLLEESLGGNSTTVMLAAMSPAGRNFSETLNTLQYAERAKKIVTKVHANVEVEVARRKSFFEARDGDGGADGGANGGGPSGRSSMSSIQEEDLARFRATQELASQATQEELQSLRVERRESVSAHSALTVAQVSLSGQLGEARASLAEAERLRAQAVAEAGVEMAAARGEAAEALAAARGESATAMEGARAEATEARREAAEAQSGAKLATATIEQRGREAAVEAARLEAALEQERSRGAAAAGERDTVSGELQMLRLELASAQARGAAAAERREEEAATAAATEQSLRASLESKDQERAAALEALHTRHAAVLEERQQEQQARQEAQLLQVDTQRTEQAREMLSRLEAAAAAQARHQADEQARALQQVQSQVQAQLQQLQTDQADGLKMQAGTEAGGVAALTKRHEAEMARRAAEVTAAQAAGGAAVEAVELRAREQAARAEEQQRLLGHAHEAQQASLQAALLAAQAEQVRLHGDNATRRGAADALGERVVLLQEQVASAQLDLEQSRHAAIAEKAHLESELRERQEDLEVARVEGLSATHEAERLRAQLADKTAALQKLHAVYERTVQETRRVEDEAQAERHALHSERRQLELRLQEESRRAQRAGEALEKLKREGLLGRLFSGGDDSNGDSHAQAKSMPVRLPPDAGRV